MLLTVLLFHTDNLAGYGVILSATWLLPIALLPGTWQAADFPKSPPSTPPAGTPSSSTPSSPSTSAPTTTIPPNPTTPTPAAPDAPVVAPLGAATSFFEEAEVPVPVIPPDEDYVSGGDAAPNKSAWWKLLLPF